MKKKLLFTSIMLLSVGFLSGCSQGGEPAVEEGTAFTFEAQSIKNYAGGNNDERGSEIKKTPKNVAYLPALFVKYDSSVSESVLLEQISLTVEENLGKKPTTDRGMVVDIPGVAHISFASVEDAQSAIRSIESLKGVEYVAQDHAFMGELQVGGPNDPDIGNQWYLDITKTLEAWDLPGFDAMIGGNVAHIESIANHEDLPTNGGGSSNHGTATAGLYAAITDNNIGIASLAYNKVGIDVISPMGINTNSAFGQLQAVIDNGAEIILIAQLGGFFMRDSAEALLWEYFVLANSDVTFIAAASNENLNPDTDPAIGGTQYCCGAIEGADAGTWHIYPQGVTASNMIVVGATTQSDSKAAFSSYGDWVDVSAPGMQMLTTSNNGYTEISGTSMSVALAAGLIALVGDAELVINTADPVVGNIGPRINTCKAVAASLGVSDASCSGDVDPEPVACYTMIEVAEAWCAPCVNQGNDLNNDEAFQNIIENTDCDLEIHTNNESSPGQSGTGGWMDLFNGTFVGEYSVSPMMVDSLLSSIPHAWVVNSDGEIVSPAGNPSIAKQYMLNNCNADCGGAMQICGNGMIESGEECDDGNSNNGDGCENDCTLTYVPGCGNGIVDEGEECGEPSLPVCKGTKFAPLHCSSSCTCEGMIAVPHDDPVLVDGTITSTTSGTPTTPTTITTGPGPTSTPTTVTSPTTTGGPNSEHPTRKDKDPLPGRE